MSQPLAVLSYHRVLPEPSGAHRPYFSRGTAVRASTFDAQIEALARECRLLSEGQFAAALAGAESLDAPGVLLTFDDGYREHVQLALPRLRAIGAVGVVFVTTCTLERPAALLPADAWYAALSAAGVTRGILALDPMEPWAFDLEAPEDFARLVDGPERRRYLRASREDQAFFLSRLREALRARDGPCSDLYFDVSALRALLAAGWALGSHGATHARFPDLSDAGCLGELSASLSSFERHGLPRPRSLAYPDGAPGEGSSLAAELGFELGFTVESRSIRPADDPLLLPRWIVPDDPHWVERQLLPSMARGFTCRS